MIGIEVLAATISVFFNDVHFEFLADGIVASGLITLDVKRLWKYLSDCWSYVSGAVLTTNSARIINLNNNCYIAALNHHIFPTDITDNVR